MPPSGGYGTARDRCAPPSGTYQHLGIRAEVVPGDGPGLDDAVRRQRRVIQHKTGRAHGAEGREVRHWLGGGTSGLADDDAHGHAILLTGPAEDVIHARNVEGVLPVAANG